MVMTTTMMMTVRRRDSLPSRRFSLLLVRQKHGLLAAGESKIHQFLSRRNIHATKVVPLSPCQVEVSCLVREREKRLERRESAGLPLMLSAPPSFVIRGFGVIYFE